MEIAAIRNLADRLFQQAKPRPVRVFLANGMEFNGQLIVNKDTNTVELWDEVSGIVLLNCEDISAIHAIFA